ncbi:hypothetical protein SDC9_141482 [bioreactor metagenome]|uniref:Uncharacterized protein n=1 Tax=bioreactor metagenome TaxID=1076179 RepID=A0A645DYB5_9ZZZZ
MTSSEAIACSLTPTLIMGRVALRPSWAMRMAFSIFSISTSSLHSRNSLKSPSAPMNLALGAACCRKLISRKRRRMGSTPIRPDSRLSFLTASLITSGQSAGLSPKVKEVSGMRDSEILPASNSGRISPIWPFLLINNMVGRSIK